MVRTLSPACRQNLDHSSDDASLAVRRNKASVKRRILAVSPTNSPTTRPARHPVIDSLTNPAPPPKQRALRCFEATGSRCTGVYTQDNIKLLLKFNAKVDEAQMRTARVLEHPPSTISIVDGVSNSYCFRDGETLQFSSEKRPPRLRSRCARPCGFTRRPRCSGRPRS